LEMYISATRLYVGIVFLLFHHWSEL